jgi:DnaJ family protein A protein 5
MRKFEGFGTSTTGIDKVLLFYENWENFTTYKTFVWIEEYDTREAENRWVKRRMQE